LCKTFVDRSLASVDKNKKNEPKSAKSVKDKGPKASNTSRKRKKKQVQTSTAHGTPEKPPPAKPPRHSSRHILQVRPTYVPLRDITHRIYIVPTGYHPQDLHCTPQDIIHRIYIAPHRISPTGYTLRPTGYYPQDCTSLTQETLFVPKEVVELVVSGNIRALMEKANAILDSVQKQPPSGGWEQHLPSWVGARHKRGLLGWGQSRDKATSKVVDKAWAIPKIQRAALTAAITAWMDCVGLPPTCAGQYLTPIP
jgi:hypothetical protein